MQRKIMEDPLMAIKQREIETRKKLLQNPVKLKEIHRMLQEDKKLQKSSKRRESKKSKKSKKKKKKRSKSNSSAEGEDRVDSDLSDKDLDSLLAKKYRKLQGDLNDKEEKDFSLDKLLKQKYEKLSSELDKMRKGKSKKKSKKKERGGSSDRDRDRDANEQHSRPRHEEMDSRRSNPFRRQNAPNRDDRNRSPVAQPFHGNDRNDRFSRYDDRKRPVSRERPRRSPHFPENRKEPDNRRQRSRSPNRKDRSVSNNRNQREQRSRSNDRRQGYSPKESKQTKRDGSISNERRDRRPYDDRRGGYREERRPRSRSAERKSDNRRWPVSPNRNRRPISPNRDDRGRQLRQEEETRVSRNMEKDINTDRKQKRSRSRDDYRAANKDRSNERKPMDTVRSHTPPKPHRGDSHAKNRISPQKRQNSTFSDKRSPRTPTRPILGPQRPPPKRSSSTQSSDSDSSSSSSSSSDSDRSPPVARNYGLVTAGGQKIELKNKGDDRRRSSRTPPKVASGSKKPTSTYVRPEKARLTEEDKEKRLREMQKNANWREKEREIDMKRSQYEAKRDAEKEQKTAFDRDYINKQMHKALATHTSVEARIKSNLNNIQRMGSSMNSSFVRK